MDVRLPNGTIITDLPEDVTLPDVADLAIKNGLATLDDFPDDVFETTWPEFLGGAALDLGIGTMRATKAIPDLLSMVLPDKAAENITEPVSQFFERGIDATEWLKSDNYKREQQRTAIKRDEQGEFAGFQLPSAESITGLIAGSVPQIPLFLIGGPPVARGLQTLKWFKANPAAAEALGWGTVNAAIVAPDQYRQTYQEAVASGMGEQAARDAASASALITAAVSGTTGALGGAVAQKLGAASSTVPRAVAKGFVAEAPFEGVEEAGQSLSEDIGMGRPLSMLNAADRGLMGFIGGGVPGAGIAAFENISQRQFQPLTQPQIQLELLARQAEQEYLQRAATEMPEAAETVSSNLPVIYRPPTPVTPNDPVAAAAQTAAKIQQQLGGNFPLSEFTATESTLQPGYWSVRDASGQQVGPDMSQQEATILSSMLTERAANRIVENDVDLSISRAESQGAKYTPTQKLNMKLLGRRLFHPRENVFTAEQINKAAGETVATEARTYTVAEAKQLAGDRAINLDNFVPAVIGRKERFKKVKVGDRYGIRSNLSKETVFTGFSPDTNERFSFPDAESAQAYAQGLNNRIRTGQRVYRAEITNTGLDTASKSRLEELLREKNITSKLDSPEMAPIVRAATGVQSVNSLKPADMQLLYHRLRAIPRFDKPTKLPDFAPRDYTPEQYRAASQMARNAASKKPQGHKATESIPTRPELENALGKLSDAAYGQLQVDLKADRRWREAAVKDQMSEQERLAVNKRVEDARRKESDAVLNAVRQNLNGMRLGQVRSTMVDYLRHAMRGPKGETVLGEQTGDKTSYGGYRRSMNEIFIALEAQKAKPEYQRVIDAPEDVRIDTLVRLSLDTLNHESVHAYRQADLFMKSEWELLTKLSREQRNKDGESYLERAQRDYRDLDGNGQQEEAVAELIRDGLNGTLPLTGRPRNIFQKIMEFLRGIIGLKERGGYGDFESLLTGITTGKVGARPTVDESGRPVVRTTRALERGFGPDMQDQTAYHGSGAKWDRPDLSYVGTGEGGAAFGWGFYAADTKGVASTYRDTGPVSGEMVLEWQGVPQEEWAERWRSLGPIGRDEAIRNYRQNQGYLYELDIPDKAISRMLDWDAPLNEQSPEVTATLEALGKFGPGEGHTLNEWAELGHRGESLYQDILGRWSGRSEKETSQFLAKLGIPGLKYMDQFSRDIGAQAARAPQGLIKPLIDAVKGTAERAPTYNYVVFDEKYVKPLTRNGQPIDMAEQRPTRPRVGTTGQYIGFPKDIDSPQKVAALLGKVNSLAEEGEYGKFWFERSAQRILDITNYDYDEAEKLTKAIAITSVGTRPELNFRFAVQAYLQSKDRGNVRTGRRPNQVSPKLQAVLDGKPWTGISKKTKNFYNNLMMEIDPKRMINPGKMHGVTIDIWMMRAFGHATENPTDQQYKQLSKEITYIADQLTQRTGTEWKPHQVQAAIWVALKSRMENPGVKKKTNATSLKNGWAKYTKDRNGRKVLKVINKKQHNKLWLQNAMRHSPTGADKTRAKFDYADAIEGAKGQASVETVPGKTTNHFPEARNATPQQLAEFHVAMSKAILSEKNVDLVSKGLKMLSPGKFEAPGFWEGKSSPSTQREMVLPHSYKGEPYGEISESAAALMDAYSAIVGILFRQDAVGWHRPFFHKKEAKLTLDNADGVEVNIGRPFTAEETLQIASLTGHDPIASPVGVRLINFSKKNNKAFHDGIKKALTKLQIDGINNPTNKAVVGYFASDNNLVEHDWKGTSDGRLYLQTPRLAGRPDLQRKARRIISQLEPRIRAVEEEFADRYGWTRGDDLVYSRAPVSGPAESTVRPSRRSPEKTEGLILSGKAAPGAQTFVGVHYGQTETDTLEGSRFGTGIRGAEQARLAQATDERILKRAYFYIKRDLEGLRHNDPYMADKLEQAGVPGPEAGLGGHVHVQKFNNILNIDSPIANRFAHMEPNAFESAVVDAGYDGYADPSAGVMVILNHDVPVKYMGTSYELAQEGIPANRNRQAATDLLQQRSAALQNDPDYTTQNGKVVYSKNRLNNLMSEYGYANGRVIAAVVTVNPQEFVTATSPEGTFRRIKEEAGPLNKERLRLESQTPFLQVKQDEDGWSISSHEGRHRMQALADAGFTSVPVVVFNRYDLPHDNRTMGLKANGKLGSQKYGWGKDQYESLTDLNYSNPIDISYDNRAALNETYATAGQDDLAFQRPQGKKSYAEIFWEKEFNAAGIEEKWIRRIITESVPPKKLSRAHLVEWGAALKLARERFEKGLKSDIWVKYKKQGLNEQDIVMAVNALRRHNNTLYDKLLEKGVSRETARRMIEDFMTQRVMPAGYVSPRTTVRNAEPKQFMQIMQSWWDRNFRAKHNLPNEAFAVKVMTDSEKRTDNIHVEHLLRDFHAAIKTAYKKPYQSLPATTQKAMNDFLADVSNNTHGLPNEVLQPLRVMRAYLDRLSARIVADGIVEGDAAQTVMENMGHYLHRSYQAFDDKTWFDKVPAQVISDAYNFLMQQAQDTGKIKGQPIPTDPAQLRDAINGLINNILTAGKAVDNMGAFLGSEKLGRQDRSIFMKRDDIAPEIRALLGEYKDPVVNFTKSANKMAYAIANHRLIKKVVEQGLAQGWLHKMHTNEYSVQIVSDGSHSYGDLAGLYTSLEIKNAFAEILDTTVMADWARTLLMLNGLVKYGKTVLSVTTMARNFMSAAMFSMANGHLMSPDILRNIALASTTLSAELLGVDRTLSAAQQQQVLRQKSRDYYKKLTRLGVTLDNPYPGEMMAAMQDAMRSLNSIGTAPAKIEGTIRQKARHVFSFFTKMYQYGDDFWKIIGFESEKDALIRSGMPQMEAEVEAAKRIRDTYPTYSLIGKSIKFLRRLPLVGTFVSFPAEIVRTSVNIMRTIEADRRAGRNELVARRAVGAAVAAGWASALSALSMAMVGIDDEEDEQIRKTSASWMRNSDLFYVGYDEDGNLRHIDLSFSDPYNYLKRPFNALMMGGDWKENLFGGANPLSGVRQGSALRDILDPFLGPDIAFTALSEIFTNSRLDGTGKVYNPESSASKQLVDISNHLRKAIQPGTALNIERIFKAIGNDQSRSGQQYNLQDEMFALAGLRFITRNPASSLRYKAMEIKTGLNYAANLLSYPLGGQNKTDEGDVRDAFFEMMQARERRFLELIDLIDMFEGTGMRRSEMARILNAAKISKEEIGAVMRGRVPRWKPSPQFLRSARETAYLTAPPSRRDEVRMQFRDRIKTIHQLVREYYAQK